LVGKVQSLGLILFYTKERVMQFSEVCTAVDAGRWVEVPEGFAATVRKAVAESGLRLVPRWRVNVATRNPRQLAKIYAGTLDEAIAAGICQASDTTDGFDWNSLLAFIKELLPVILKIIALF